jgi:dihydrofolate reductase
MADTMNAFPKVVVSTTLERAEWQNSTLIRPNVAEAITKLKQQPGRNINMSGSGMLVIWLLRQGLLDELNLLVFPVVVGREKRLFGDGGEKMPLELTGSEAFRSGVVRLAYRPAAV